MTLVAQPPRDVGRGPEHVLAVVDDEEKPAFAQLLDHRVECCGPGTVRDADGRQHRPGNIIGRADGRQVHEPDAMLEISRHGGRDALRDACFPHAARPDDRHYSMSGNQAGDVVEVGFATDEAGELRRQVARRGTARARPVGRRLGNRQPQLAILREDRLLQPL